jgi:multidrug efflux pump subunit AcrA (membrane-fusion protein)
MEDDRVESSGSELLRWMIVALVVIAGIVLFFYFAPSSKPAVPPSVQEVSQ